MQRDWRGTAASSPATESICTAVKHCKASVKKPLPIQTIASIPSFPMEKENSNLTKPMSPHRKLGGGGGKPVLLLGKAWWWKDRGEASLMAAHEAIIVPKGNAKPPARSGTCVGRMPAKEG